MGGRTEPIFRGRGGACAGDRPRGAVDGRSTADPACRAGRAPAGRTPADGDRGQLARRGTAFRAVADAALRALRGSDRVLRTRRVQAPARAARGPRLELDPPVQPRVAVAAQVAVRRGAQL